MRYELLVFLKFHRFVGDVHQAIVSDRECLGALLVFFRYAEVLQ
jgi:hypothetical protein